MGNEIEKGKFTRNMERGKFIVIEGIGGSGKSTLIPMCQELLTQNGLKTIYTREPGGLVPAEEIRQLIFDLKDKKLIGAEGQMSLFFAARKIWINGLVGPAIDSGVNVLTDRCHTSTGAYQGYAEGGDQKKILAIADIVMRNYKPDAVIFLDIERETSLKRRGKDVNGDPFDKEPPEYFDRLIAGYREMAQNSWGGLKWYRVNAELELTEVSKSVVKVLEDIFHKKLQR